MFIIGCSQKIYSIVIEGIFISRNLIGFPFTVEETGQMLEVVIGTKHFPKIS